MSKLASRKFLMGGGAVLWAILETEVDPTKIWAVTALVIAYMVIEGLKDWAMARKAEAEKPAEPEGAAS